jgi:hypothetical protein
VEAFARSRRSIIYGWNVLDEDAVADYVCNEINHHVQHAFREDGWRSDAVFLGWVDSVPPDAIAAAAWRCVGGRELTSLAEAAAERGDWVSAALRFNAAATWFKRSNWPRTVLPLMCAHLRRRVRKDVCGDSRD